MSYFSGGTRARPRPGTASPSTSGSHASGAAVHARPPRVLMMQPRGLRGLGQTGCEWISQANGSPYWGCYVDSNGQCCAVSGNPCTSSYVGCAGGPPAPAPPSPGNSAGANIIAENAQFAADPNLQSAAYLATQAAYTPGGVAPTPGQDTLSELVTYCTLNTANHNEFGDPLDTVTCPNGAPAASMVAQASALTPVVVATGPPPAAPAAPPVAAVCQRRFGRWLRIWHGFGRRESCRR